jgi:ribosome biogenesis SPOUT family RNA methylase Rps3
MRPEALDPAAVVQELSANPSSNCALHYLVGKAGGKIIIPTEEFERVRREVKDAQHPLVAYFDPAEGIVLQVV